MSKNTGGSAFPLPVERDQDCFDRLESGYGGMTLRDYFAAKAMQSMAVCGFKYLTEHPDDGLKPLTTEASQMLHDIGESAYLMADAMLRARDSN